MPLARQIAQSLEEGRDGPLSSVIAAGWGRLAARRLVKDLSFPPRARVLAIGGSTLGGSGKTPLALASTEYLAQLGARVAFVGHAYRARPNAARIVRVDDDLGVVGDEALLAARTLAPLGIPVVVAPNRQAALDLALTHADVVVLDGVAQIGPVAAHLALLAVDGARPWGAGRCPPCGDLRAPERALLAVCDRVVAFGATVPLEGRPVDVVETRSAGAWAGDVLLDWDALRERRVGLWASLGRPERVVETLRSHGIRPVVTIGQGDHTVATASMCRQLVEQGLAVGVDVWVSTPKCALSLPPTLADVPMAVLARELTLPTRLKETLSRLLAAKPAR
jgi:tetraacyldisaccharide 4'-kinase